jgi:hypothetical protein
MNSLVRSHSTIRLLTAGGRRNAMGLAQPTLAVPARSEAPLTTKIIHLSTERSVAANRRPKIPANSLE